MPEKLIIEPGYTVRDMFQSVLSDKLQGDHIQDLSFEYIRSIPGHLARAAKVYPWIDAAALSKIPLMSDSITEAVLMDCLHERSTENLDKPVDTQLLMINDDADRSLRPARRLVAAGAVTSFGYPFGSTEAICDENLNCDMDENLRRLEKI